MTFPSTREVYAGQSAAVGITESLIHDLVHAFYGRVRQDPRLGPIFDREIGDGWVTHLAKLCDFWSSVMLMTGRFKGQPMAVHAAIPDLESAHFARWLELFDQTLRDICTPEAAAMFAAKAQLIGQSLQFGIAAKRGELPPAA